MDSTPLGSPPRMRGKAPLIFCGICGAGITPAYAGKRGFEWQELGAEKDHPRVCGEKRFCVSMVNPALGSPPRMRGKEQKEYSSELNLGITPAYAGKSPPLRLTSSGTRDHPRVCGEKCRATSASSARKGSPPRMRGKECAHMVCHPFVGSPPRMRGKAGACNQDQG